MPSTRTKQIRRSKANVAYYRRQQRALEDDRISSVVAADVEVEQKNMRDIHGASLTAPGSAVSNKHYNDRSRNSNTLARVNRYAIEKVMAGYGSVVENRAFGSGECSAASSHQNSWASFYRIHISSYCSPAWKNVAFAVHAETILAKSKATFPRAPTPRIHKSNYRRASTIIRNAVRTWCIENPGFSLSKRGPGAQGKSSVALSHYVKGNARVFHSGSKGCCLFSAVINAFERHQGEKFG